MYCPQLFIINAPISIDRYPALVKEQDIKPNEISIASLGLLAAAAAENKDYLDYITPFILQLARAELRNSLNPHILQDALKSKYGLTFPTATLNLCLKRLRHSGVLYIRRPYRTYHLSDNHNPTQPDLAESQKTHLRRLRAILDRLIAFAKEQFGTNVSLNQAVAMMTSYLLHFSIDFLRAYTNKSALPVVAADRTDIFVVNALVREAQEHDPALLESIDVFVKGYMLSNALLCPDLNPSAQHYSGLTIYLDTPLFFDLLGLHGSEQREAALEAVALCKELGATVAIFSHTDREAFSTIKFCAKAVEDIRVQKGKIIKEARARGISGLQLELLAHNLEREYAKLGIVLHKTPKHLVEFQIDEKILDVALDEDIAYHYERARHNDIDSIRAIYTLREGSAPKSLDKCRAIMVTNNAALAKVAYEFGRQFESSTEVSTVITEFSLANMAWLKRPLVSSSLPKFEMIALAYTALNPSEAFWKRTLAEIERAVREKNITPRDHAIARISPRMQREMMNLTLGREENITQTTVVEAIERIRNELVAEERARANAAEALAAESRANAERLRQEIEIGLEKEAAILRKLSLLSERAGRIVKVTIFVTLACAYAAALVLPPLFVWESVGPYIRGGIVAIGIIITIVLAAFGGSLLEWARRVGNRSGLKLKRMLMDYFVPESVDLREMGKLIEGGTPAR